MAKLDSRFVSVVSGFKNRIINGDFSVAQRGEYHSLYNTSKYTLDRVRVWSAEHYLSQWRGKIHAPDEGITANVLDIFGDGSCVACYPLDGNANDLSGKYNGTWHGNEQYDVGRFGQAAKFDGSSYIQTDLTGVLPQEFTISLWIYVLYSTGESVDLGLGTTHDETLTLITNRDGKFCFYSGSGGILYFAFPLQLRKWFHLTVVNKSDKSYLYVDGVLRATHSALHRASSELFRIGGGVFGSTQFGHNLIDQVRIFNRALTEDEVKALYVESNNYEERPSYFLVTRIDNINSSATKRGIAPYVYRFEGQHLYDLAISGKKVTLSFEFASNKNGKYSLSFRNCTDGKYDSYVRIFEYTGNGKFQRFEFTFDLSEFPKRFKNDINKGFELIICGNHPNFKAPGEGLFCNVDYHFADGTNNFDVGDWFKISNIQLEEGDRATDFEYVPYDIQLLRCMRYYEKINCQGISASWVDPTQVFCHIPYKVIKRTTPSVVDSRFTYWTGSSSVDVSVNKFSLWTDSLMVNLAEPADRTYGSSFPLFSGSYVVVDAEI